VFNNARLFNEEKSEVYEAANALENHFNELLAQSLTSVRALAAQLRLPIM
jgi:hypothetical protein